MSKPSIFISHNHRDKHFVRTLAQDLGALGVRVWLDEAEIRVGDSLIEKISTAIDEMRYLGIVLSPNSVESRWVKEELSQALVGQLSERDTVVLPIMLVDCQVPGFLRGRAYADFRDPDLYEESLKKLIVAMDVDISKGSGASIHDPFAKQLGRVSNLYARPKVWHCIFCGWRCEESYNDYMCRGCGALRPFAGEEATMVICRECGQCSLGVARFCEWCGTNLTPSTGQTLTYRCPYDSARIVMCPFSAGERVKAGESIVMLRLPNGRDVPYPGPILGSFDCVVEELFVTNDQLVFAGTPLARVVRLD
jgi:TIR domain